MTFSSPSLGMNPGRRCLARSKNSLWASSAASASSRQTVSPGTPSSSREVVSIRSLLHDASSRAARSAQASRTCSQLSRTMSTSRSARWAHNASSAATPVALRTPSTLAVSVATSGAFAIDVRSTIQTPSCRRDT